MECEDVEAYSDDILYRRHRLLTSRPYHLNSVEGVPGFISVELPMRVSLTFCCRWIACCGNQKRHGSYPREMALVTRRFSRSRAFSAGDIQARTSRFIVEEPFCYQSSSSGGHTCLSAGRGGRKAGS